MADVVQFTDGSKGLLTPGLLVTPLYSKTGGVGVIQMAESKCSWFHYSLLCLMWSAIGFFVGFAIFGIVWNPNRCIFLELPLVNQIMLLTKGFFLGPLMGLDLYLPAPLGGVFITLPLLVYLIVALIIGIRKGNILMARISLYLALALWFSYGSLRWALLC